MAGESPGVPRLAERLSPVFAEALAVHAGGERYEWDLGPAGIDNPDGTTVAILLLHVWIRNPAVLGTWISTTARIGDPVMATPEKIDQVAVACFAQLAAARASALATANGKR